MPVQMGSCFASFVLICLHYEVTSLYYFLVLIHETTTRNMGEIDPHQSQSRSTITNHVRNYLVMPEFLIWLRCILFLLLK